jgi:FkbM family methyltransferase
LDVGANVGQTLLDYQSAPRRAGYLAFEPNPFCVDHLLRVIRTNRLEGCRVIPAGLSDASGIAELLIENEFDADPTATMMSELRPGRAYSSRFISCHRLDDLASSLITGPVSMIKIDVEGAESLALRGMRESITELKPWILCEVLRRDPGEPAQKHAARTAEIMRMLSVCGYEALNILKSGDVKQVVGFQRVTGFPQDPFTQETKEANDYLFVPKGEDVNFLAIHPKA